MTMLPLITHPSQDNVIAWNADGAVTVRQFLADVAVLSSAMLPGRYVLNICCDRYRFSVAVAAALATEKISLLPSSHTPEAVRQMKLFAPDMFCITDKICDATHCSSADADAATLDLPKLHYPAMPIASFHAQVIPTFNSQQLVAIVFTSGSTGIPTPHRKTWGNLVMSVQAEAARIGLLNNPCPNTLIGTVPPQHMYGLESTVLMAWQSGHALCHAQPFFPADVCEALTKVPAPRVLVSSPVHLRALLEADISLPNITNVISATAPLSNELATKIEARTNAPVLEVYGSTETGLIATRRTTQTQEWHLLPGVKLINKDEHTYAYGGHVTEPIIMGDFIELISDKHFLLQGRLTDLVNIAGKRHSLACLNYLLNSIPGVTDGVFFMPDDTGATGVTRLAACVVATGMTSQQLVAALRQCIDPVFLPRPLLMLDSLPRNATGKLTRAAMQQIFGRQHGKLEST